MNNEYLRSLEVYGFDGGNKLGKTAAASFHAGIDPLAGKPAVGMADEMDLLRINGRYYAVSETRLKYERDKSVNDNYLYLTLIGIAKELRARGRGPEQEIVLAVGLPPGHMENESLSRPLRDYYLRNGGVYQYRCGGIVHRIAIREVVVCPQAYSIFLTLPREVIGQPSVHIVDAGGGTVDDVNLVNGRPSLDMLSLDKGVIPLYNKIQARLANQYGRSITERQIDDIILGRPTLFRQEHTDLVHSLADAHVRDIFGAFREHGADWLSGFVVFCGGGSILLGEYIRKYAGRSTGDYIIVEDVCANAKGFEVFARITLKNRK